MSSTFTDLKGISKVYIYKNVALQHKYFFCLGSRTVSLSVFSIGFLVIQLIMKIFNICKFQKRGIVIARKLVVLTLRELPLLIISFIYLVWSIVVTAKGNCHSKSGWIFGIFAVLLGWTIFALKISKLPIIGDYVIIFTKICKTFLKVSLFGILLLLASLLVLYMVFYNPMAPVSCSSFIQV